MNVYEDVAEFYAGYRGEKTVIGRSLFGREIFAFYVGARGAPAGISQYAIHAREWLTAYLALQHIRRGLARGGAWVVPLVNPDGALLVQEGAESAPAARRGELLYQNGGADFSLWKANGRGVDLNVNFDARWGTGAGNRRVPGPAGYVGRAPFSESESHALADFTLRVSPRFTISWHTKGEKVYWRFRQPFFRARRDRRLARVLGRATGYPLRDTPHSAGGYKDWCIDALKIPAFTVEAGKDSFAHPLGFAAFGDILAKNVDALFEFTEACLRHG